MNVFVATGNIGNDIELKTTGTGKSVATFSFAVKDPYNSKKTDWFTVVCWGNLAERVSKYLGKGSKIAVIGRMTTREWQDKNNNKRTAYEVVAENVEFLDSKGQAKPTGDFEEIETGNDLPF